MHTSYDFQHKSFNNFTGGRTFSELVAEAKQAGYTEPDPWDDRSGTDDSASAEEFMQKLPQFDQEMSKKRQTAEDAGGVLRFVGVVDMVNQKGEVKL
ncbi:hypothetical protein DVH24_030476 [Malus domestica]|uniref:Homoserine dehydrogenase catalytic domain-containing protein n=1 Tax=Malus domestica TaxID=3750 RepID=A0A498JXQ3_MALDO|nr:hypothetical protein DVH24_030476 [Malus domestica]